MDNTLTSNLLTDDAPSVIQNIQLDYVRLAEHYVNIPFELVEAAVLPMLSALQRRGATSYHFTLGWGKSLHVRGNLPDGAMHVSVLFDLEEPQAGIENDDHDTIYQEFDNKGAYMHGATGRFFELVPTI